VCYVGGDGRRRRKITEDPNMAERVDPPRRQRDARKDATVGSIEKHIADTYGLPPKAIRIVRANGDDARSDKTIRTLRQEYEDQEG
jgi:hypothetical protein